MFSFGLSNGIAKVPIKLIGSKKTVFFRNLFVSIILLFVLLFNLSGTRFDLTYILIAAGISIIAYIPLLSYYKAIRLGKIGVIAPIANSSVIFTVLFSLIFFSETVTTVQFLAIGVIIFGIIFESLDLSDIRKSNLFSWKSGRPYALITCFLWGVVFFLFKIPVSILGPFLTAFIIETGIAVMCGLDLGLNKKGFRLKGKNTVLLLFLVALFGALASLFYNIGITYSKVAIVSALTFSSPIVTTLYGKFVYREKLSPRQWFSVCAIIAGVVMIYYF
jgi:drug/metabolite transporter (DMT)-like permease